MTTKRAIATILVLLTTCSAALAGIPDRPQTFEGSFWYVVDHVTEAAEGSEIVLTVVVPSERDHQDVKIGNIFPAPESITTDPDHGNRLVTWRVVPEPGMEQIYFRVDFSGTAVEPSAVTTPDRRSDLWSLYTRNEPWIETGGAVGAKAREIVGAERNPYLQARLLFDWLSTGIEFMPGGTSTPGAEATLDVGRGDCGQISRLFVAMCRSLEIPARTVSNVWLDGGRHRFAEFHVEPYGWIPVDISVAQALDPETTAFSATDLKAFRLARGLGDARPSDMFGSLYRNHLVVTVGNNIVLPAPEGATPLVCRVMEPGGANAVPQSIAISGLNDDIVHGGFYVFDRHLSTEEAHQMAHRLMAEQFFQVGLVDAVEAGCLMATEEHTDGVRTWINMGRVHLHKKDLARAEACFLRAINEASIDRGEKLDAMVWAHNYLGNCYDLMERREMALDEYRRVVNLAIDYKGAVSYALKYLDQPYRN